MVAILVALSKVVVMVFELVNFDNWWTSFVAETVELTASDANGVIEEIISVVDAPLVLPGSPRRSPHLHLNRKDGLRVEGGISWKAQITPTV